MTAQDVLRRLGGFERGYDLWSRDHPMHFCVAAELRGPLEPERLRHALDQVRRRHRLLAARVVDTGGDLTADAPLFVRADDPVEVRAIPPGTTWQAEVGRQLATPFAPGAAPLVRAALLSSARPDEHVVVLAFEHSVADGRSAVAVLGDLVASLGGAALADLPVPPSQEELLAGLERSAPPSPPAGADDERLSAPAVLRPFDGAAPQVSSAAWSEPETRELLERCHRRGVSVNSALVAASAHVRAARSDVVRVVVPFDLRSVVEADGSVGLYIGGLRPAWTAEQTGDLWSLAEEVGSATAAARAPGAAAAASDAVQQLWGGALDLPAVLDALVAGNTFEVMVSNLGVVDPIANPDLAVTAVWGPVLLDQQQGEEVVGAATYGGALRLLHVSHAPTPDLLAEIKGALLGDR